MKKILFLLIPTFIGFSIAAMASEQNLELQKKKLYDAMMCNDVQQIEQILYIKKSANDEDNSMLSKLLSCPINFWKESILSCAVDRPQVCPKIIELLLQAGADPNAYGLSSCRAMTALHLAINEYLKLTEGSNRQENWCQCQRGSRYEIIKLLLDYGADPLLVNGAGETACSMGNNCKRLKDLFDQVLKRKIDRALSVQTPPWFSRIGAPTHWWARAGLAALSGLGTYKALRAIQVPYAGRLSLCLSAGIFLAKPMSKGITWAIERFCSKKH